MQNRAKRSIDHLEDIRRRQEVSDEQLNELVDKYRGCDGDFVQPRVRKYVKDLLAKNPRWLWQFGYSESTLLKDLVGPAREALIRAVRKWRPGPGSLAGYAHQQIQWALDKEIDEMPLRVGVRDDERH